MKRNLYLISNFTYIIAWAIMLNACNPVVGTIPPPPNINLTLCGLPLTVSSSGTTTTTQPPQIAGSAYNEILFATNNTTSEPVNIYHPLTNTWTLDALSIPRNNIGVGSVDNKIFFAGGGGPVLGIPYDIINNPLNASDLTSQIDVFNTITNTWSVLHLSEAKARVAVGSAGHVIAFSSGVLAGAFFSTNIDIYDNASNSWSVAQGLNSYGQAGAGAGNKIVFFGGGTSIAGVVDTRAQIYDVVSKTWTTEYLDYGAKDMAGAGACNTIIFAGGVNQDNDPTDLVAIYDVIGDTWSIAHLSTTRGEGVFAAALGNKIFIGGGTNVQTVDVYDANNGTWSTEPVTGLRTVGAGAVNKMLIGGPALTKFQLSGIFDIFSVGL
jgi:hypothetical protein